MAKDVKTWEGRRALTDNSGSNPKALVQAAGELIKLNQLAEAASLAAVVANQELLREIMGLAVEAGNFFIFNFTWSRLQDKDIDRGLVSKLKDVAERHGQALYQEQALAWLAEKR